MVFIIDMAFFIFVHWALSAESMGLCDSLEYEIAFYYLISRILSFPLYNWHFIESWSNRWSNKFKYVIFHRVPIHNCLLCFYWLFVYCSLLHRHFRKQIWNLDWNWKVVILFNRQRVTDNRHTFNFIRNAPLFIIIIHVIRIRWIYIDELTFSWNMVGFLTIACSSFVAQHTILVFGKIS